MVLEKHRLNEESFAWLLGEIEARFMTCLVNPGEMVCMLCLAWMGIVGGRVWERNM